MDQVKVFIDLSNVSYSTTRVERIEGGYVTNIKSLYIHLEPGCNPIIEAYLVDPTNRFDSGEPSEFEIVQVIDTSPKKTFPTLVEISKVDVPLATTEIMNSENHS